MGDKSTPDQIARATLGVPVNPPCGCCKAFSGGASWVVDGCDCGNYDDSRAAQAWCTAENMVGRVRRLIIRLNEYHASNLFDEMVETLKLVRKTCGGPENWNGETRRFLEATDAVLAKVKDEGHD